MKKINKLCSVFLLCFLGLVLFSVNCSAATQGETTVKATVTSGDLSIAPFNGTDIHFLIRLNGKKQTKELDSIQMNIHDFRGIPEGWLLLVESPNFQQYKENYVIHIGKVAITEAPVIVFEEKDQVMQRSLRFDPTMYISQEAKAGKYTSLLEWTLQPAINKLNE